MRGNLTFAAKQVRLGPVTGGVNVGKTLLLCAAATLAVITIVFVVMPAPFHGNALVLAVDAIVLIVGAVAMIVVPVVVMRSR